MNKINIKEYINSSLDGLKGNKLFKLLFVSIICIAVILISFTLINKLIPVEYSSYSVKSETVTCNIDLSNRALFEELYDVTFNTEKANFEVVIPIDINSNYDILVKSIKCDGYKTVVNRLKDRVRVIIKVEANDKENSSSYNRKIKLSYVVDEGEDFDNTCDAINYYLASPYRGFRLDKYSFSINFPKSLKSSISDSYKIFTITGVYNQETIFQKNDTKVSVINDGLTITGTVNKGLDAYQGVKIYHNNIYDKYFEDVRNVKSDSNKLIGLFIIFFFICFINFFLCGKDGTLIYQTSEEIPKQISPLLAGLFIVDSKKQENEVNEYEFKHLSSLIIKWANEGYLSIEPYKVHISLDDEVEQNEKLLESLENGEKIEKQVDEYKIEYRFRKLKEAMRSSMPYFEKYIFDGLFVLSVNGCVDTNVIKNNMGPFKEYIAYFATQIENAKKEALLYANKVKDSFIDKRAKRMKNDLKIISFAMWTVAIAFKLVMHNFYITKLIAPSIFLVLLALLYIFSLKNNNIVNVLSTLLVLILGYYLTGFALIPYLILSLNTAMLVVIRKYTFEYELIVEKIKSFSKFLSKKRDRTGIVNALNDNPKFFYEALPYAITFRKLKVLINRTREFNLAMPGWLIMQPEGFSIDVISQIDEGINEVWSDILEKNNENILKDN